MNLKLKFQKLPMTLLIQSVVPGEKGSYFHFWATWCAPCEKELPEFIELIESLNGLVMQKVIYFSSKDDPKKVLRYLRKV